ncbi:peptidase A2 domain-containing protein [Trichonephila clavipes]|nr:peptidase A2 domain-containing protein [Trichonephila clavipes]
MMYLGHLRPSKSNYTSPLHMVPKKGTLDWKPVGDYRALNSQTLKDKYPIPFIADFTAELHGSKLFSRIYLVKAYYQIPIHPDDSHKTQQFALRLVYLRVHESNSDYVTHPQRFNAL